MTIFSVVIPTYRRPESLRNCLASFTTISFSRNAFEIIVVDDGGSDAEEIARHFSNGLSIRVLRQENAGPARARNRGVGIAKGKYVAFIDDDCAADSQWLSEMQTALSRDGVSAAGGKTINAYVRNIYSETSQMILDVVYAHYNVNHERAIFCASNNLACPRDVFHSAGGFNESYRTSEDREFCDRLNRTGRRMVFTPGAVVRHSHDLNFRNLWNQHFHYGMGAFQFHSDRKKLGYDGLKVDPGFYFNLARAPLRKTFAQWPGLFSMLLTAQLANLSGYFRAHFQSMSSPKEEALLTKNNEAL